MHTIRKGYGRWAAVSVVALALTAGVSCGDDDDPSGGTGPDVGPFSLTFRLDDSFQGPHGGQEIFVVVFEASTGTEIARDNGTVSATQNPSFSFATGDVLAEDTEYGIHYWIDSNFGGGSEGVCDATNNDHQWSVDVAAPTTDVTITEAHDPSGITDVCASFAADLTFSGDATFQGPHGDQMVTVAVVRSDGLEVASGDATVSATADPSFSFSFPGALVIGQEYDIEYWIDSNFGGGTVGACDAPQIDHQWRTNVGAVDDDVAITDAHNPGAITDVCGSPGLVSFATQVQAVFTGSCAFPGGCHAGDTPAMGMNLSAGQAYAAIVDVASGELPSMDRIEPGQPDLSYLIHKIQGTQVSVGGSGQRMPAGGAQPLDPAVIEMIRLWVTQGARDN